MHTFLLKKPTDFPLGDHLFDDETLDWALGVGEHRTYTKSNTRKRKKTSSSASHLNAKAKKNKSKSLIDEDDDYEENDENQDDEHLKKRKKRDILHWMTMKNSKMIMLELIWRIKHI